MRKNGRAHFIIEGSSSGNSMEPLIKPGVRLRVDATHKEEYAVGDIVVFMKAGSFIAHRIIGVGYRRKAPYYSLKGDNNSKLDSPIEHTAVLGIVTHVLSDRGTIDLTDTRHGPIKRFLTLYSIMGKHRAFLPTCRRIWNIGIFKPFFRSLLYRS